MMGGTHQGRRDGCRQEGEWVEAARSQRTAHIFMPGRGGAEGCDVKRKETNESLLSVSQGLSNQLFHSDHRLHKADCQRVRHAAGTSGSYAGNLLVGLSFPARSPCSSPQTYTEHPVGDSEAAVGLHERYGIQAERDLRTGVHDLK